MTNRIDMPEYPNRIREWRDLRGITQEELADKIGSFKTHISAWERGKTDLAMRWMHRIADALDVTVADLLSAKDNPIAADEQLKTIAVNYASASEQGRHTIAVVAEASTGYRAGEKIIPFPTA
jgi:transcriptional regulator with XRE-family HTH domain